jgi:integration host factor subunit beta
VDAYAFVKTRSEIIERLAGHHGIDPGEEKMVVQEILGAMARAVSDGRRIEIRGFGSFALSRIPPRAGRNSKTGESVVVPGKARPRFKADKELRERLASQG